jgi:hypothetical protein
MHVVYKIQISNHTAQAQMLRRNGNGNHIRGLALALDNCKDYHVNPIAWLETTILPLVQSSRHLNRVVRHHHVYNNVHLLYRLCVWCEKDSKHQLIQLEQPLMNLNVYTYARRHCMTVQERREFRTTWKKAWTIVMSQSRIRCTIYGQVFALAWISKFIPWAWGYKFDYEFNERECKTLYRACHRVFRSVCGVFLEVRCRINICYQKGWGDEYRIWYRIIPELAELERYPSLVDDREMMLRYGRLHKSMVYAIIDVHGYPKTAFHKSEMKRTGCCNRADLLRSEPGFVGRMITWKGAWKQLLKRAMAVIETTGLLEDLVPMILDCPQMNTLRQLVLTERETRSEKYLT